MNSVVCQTGGFADVVSDGLGEVVIATSLASISAVLLCDTLAYVP